jgi:hypothetical protein
MFSSIAAPAFQGLAAVDIRHGDDKEHKRNHKKDQVEHLRLQLPTALFHSPPLHKPKRGGRL